MRATSTAEVYLPREIAEAAGVPLEHVIGALGGADGFVARADAVRLGSALRRARMPFVNHRRHDRGRPLLSLAASGTFHAAAFGALVLVTTLGVAPAATPVLTDQEPAADLRLVFLARPGPGGGGGGGGLRQRLPPPKAEREGRRAMSSPMPVRKPPQPIEPAPAPPEPKPPPLSAEALPAVVAPIVASPADPRDRAGVLQEARGELESRGPGQGGGTGSGAGTGLGSGDGPGVGPGTGGGTGGGPYRPGSGIEPPRLLREIKADYTDAARRSGLEGEVLLEIVVRRDGSVGDVRVLRRLGAGLDERAVEAVRGWRFAPAKRQGTPVDVLVEVSVEFKLR
jgi:TonB family protein